MKKTKNALEVLKRDLDKNQYLKELVEEERINFQAALAIREARKKASLTQAQLAKEIGTTQSVIARLEDADYRGHALKMLEHIAEALGRRVEIRFRPVAERRAYAFTH